MKTRDLQEPFAPSQFHNFDDATKLRSRPSCRRTAASSSRGSCDA